MKRKEFNRYIYAILYSTQKVRGRLQEKFPELNEEELGTLFPWLFGTKSILRAIMMTVERIERGDAIEDASALWQILSVIEHFTPEIEVTCAAQSVFLPRSTEVIGKALV